jgi:predicted metal-dependent peptidase
MMTHAELKHRLDKARWWIIQQAAEIAFYGRLAMELTDVLTTDSKYWLGLVEEAKTACTDGKKVYWYPTYVDSLDDEELRYVLIHEVLHPAYLHFFRLPCNELGNWCADCEIWCVLDGIKGIKQPKGGVVCPKKYRGWPCEKIYADKMREQQEEKQKQQQQQQDQDDQDDDQDDDQEPQARGQDKKSRDDEQDDEQDQDDDQEGQDQPGGKGNSKPGKDKDKSQKGQGAGSKGQDDQDNKGQEDEGQDQDQDGEGQNQGQGQDNQSGSQGKVKPDSGKPGKSQDPYGKCGGFVQPDPEVKDDGTMETKEDLRDHWQRVVIQADIATQLAKGNTPSNMTMLLEKLRHQKIDWRNETHDFVREQISQRNNWLRPARRHAWQDCLYPSRQEDDPGMIVVGRDTSGSMYDQHTLSVTTACINDAIDSTGARAYVVDFDMVAAQVQKVERGGELEGDARGGGGTSFEPVWEVAKRLNEEGERVSGIIMVTDMAGTFGEDPELPLLWISTKGQTWAPFGRVVLFEE